MNELQTNMLLNTENVSINLKQYWRSDRPVVQPQHDAAASSGHVGVTAMIASQFSTTSIQQTTRINITNQTQML